MHGVQPWVFGPSSMGHAHHIAHRCYRHRVRPAPLYPLRSSHLPALLPPALLLTYEARMTPRTSVASTKPSTGWVSNRRTSIGMPRAMSTARHGICSTRRERPGCRDDAHPAAVEALMVKGLRENSSAGGGGQRPFMNSGVISCRVRSSLPCCANCRNTDKTGQAEWTCRAQS